MSEIIMSLVIIVLASILMCCKKNEIVPLTFEANEKFTNKNKWFVFILIRALFIFLNSFSNLFYAETPMILFAFLFDTIFYGTLLYLFAAKKDSFFTFVYFLIPIETFIIILNANISHGDFSNILLYTGFCFCVWLLPNYIYFFRRRTLFKQINAKKISERVINETLEDMKKDLAIALQYGELELAKTISQRIYETTTIKDVETTIHSKGKSNGFLTIISEVCILLSTFLAWILSISASIFYVYTLYIYFTDYGFWQGFLSMILPILSTIWLCVQKWIEEGIDNTVTNCGIIWLIGLGITFILYGLGAYISSITEQDNNP